MKTREDDARLRPGLSFTIVSSCHAQKVAQNRFIHPPGVMSAALAGHEGMVRTTPSHFLTDGTKF